MVCSMIKKGVLGTALGAGTLFLVFGTLGTELREDGLPQGSSECQGIGRSSV